MKNKKILIAGSIAAAMLLMGGAIPLTNAGAASTTVSSSGTSPDTVRIQPKFPLKHGGFRGFGLRGIQDNLLKFLNLDEATFKEEISSKSLAEIAQEQNITRDDLKAQLVKWLESTQMNKTNKQGKAQKIDFSAMVDKMLDAKGFIGEKHPPEIGFGRMLGNSDELAAALGLTADKLKEALKSGQTLSQIATAQKVDLATVTNLLVSKEKERIDALLKDGKLTQDQYTKLLADATDRITKMVNGEFPGKAGFGPRGERPDGPAAQHPSSHTQES